MNVLILIISPKTDRIIGTGNTITIRYSFVRIISMNIHTLCVHPECVGIGIGSAIVEFAKELAKQKNCVSIRLNTTSRNTLAKHLYEKNGFNVVSKQKILLNGQIACNEHSFMEFIIQ